MANTNSNKKLVPEAMNALNRFKYEVASEVGVNLKMDTTVIFLLEMLVE